MGKSIYVFSPDETKYYEEGLYNVTQINVRYYFSNVVLVDVYFDTGRKISFYQIPCYVVLDP